MWRADRKSPGTTPEIEGLLLSSLIDRPCCPRNEIDGHRQPAVLVCLIVSANDDAGHIVGDLDRLRAAKGLL